MNVPGVRPTAIMARASIINLSEVHGLFFVLFGVDMVLVQTTIYSSFCHILFYQLVAGLLLLPVAIFHV